MHRVIRGVLIEPSFSKISMISPMNTRQYHHHLPSPIACQLEKSHHLIEGFNYDIKMQCLCRNCRHKCVNEFKRIYFPFTQKKIFFFSKNQGIFSLSFLVFHLITCIYLTQVGKFCVLSMRKFLLEFQLHLFLCKLAVKFLQRLICFVHINR